MCEIVYSLMSHINGQIKSEMTMTMSLQYVNENLMRFITERIIGITNKLKSKTFRCIEA